MNIKLRLRIAMAAVALAISIPAFSAEQHALTVLPLGGPGYLTPTGDRYEGNPLRRGSFLISGDMTQLDDTTIMVEAGKQVCISIVDPDYLNANTFENSVTCRFVNARDIRNGSFVIGIAYHFNE